jgi:hypothetical protein
MKFTSIGGLRNHSFIHQDEEFKYKCKECGKVFGWKNLLTVSLSGAIQECFPLRFPHKNDVRFVFTSSCLQCMSYLRYLCLFAYSGVQHILCCVFILFFFILWTLSCQFLWIVQFRLPLRYSLAFIFHYTALTGKNNLFMIPCLPCLLWVYSYQILCQLPVV